ncbi:Hypothetical protein SRAE_0000026650 [Strongyloides ratti]|uniref:Uncharacterized protein n=1 Tax=Strongyloides ratti TaxID=34506 RepID=A0A090MSB1_STRRB|nr:Hypothetical protein SRAE_0000026650 [Strongyloides ratti]CEF61138.1 Hypothetical protein SRAE_0000026650 [Strongyloides ratti]
MIKLFLFLFNILIISNEQQYVDKIIEEKCNIEHAQIYNPYFKNQKLFIIADDCNFIEYKTLNYTLKNNNCNNSLKILLMSEEFIENDTKFKSIYILYKNDLSQRFELKKVYEEKSNVYYVPGQLFFESNSISTIQKINCRIVDIIINFLSSNYNITKNAFFIRITTDLYEDKKVIINVYITFKNRNNFYIKMFTLLINFDESNLDETRNVENCTDKNANKYYKIISFDDNYKILHTSQDSIQVLYYNDFTINVKKIFNYYKLYNEIKIELIYKNMMKSQVTLCLDKINISRPIYIYFYDEDLFEKVENDRNMKYIKNRNTIIYIIIIVILIIIIFLSSKIIKKEYKKKNIIDKKKKIEKKKNKKLYEIINEKLKQQLSNNDNGNGPIVPYVKFDKRYNEKKIISKKRITGMKIKTLSKNIEYVST